MKKENNILETLATGALAVVVVRTLFKAFEKAQETEVPLLVEEDGALYEINRGKQKKFIRNLPPRPHIHIPQSFTLSNEQG
ncbi:MAG: hypothetical protein GXC72_05170 [Chitinophagaceae bacterium]|nr:hypothetical protein [Chitinophagaceae bacterium]